MPWRRGLQVVLFDIDDTLTDYRAIVDGAMRQVHAALAAVGLPTAEADFLAHFWRVKLPVEVEAESAGWSIMEVRRRWMIATLAACGHPDAAHPDDLAVLYAEVRDRTVVYQPDAEAVVQQLAQAYRLGIVSGGGTRLEHFPLAGHFHDALFSYQVGLWKPDPLIFRAALERLGCDPHEAVYVGDDPYRDVAGAIAAGVRSVWFNPGGRAYPPDAPPPDYVATSLHDVAAHLLAGREVPSIPRPLSPIARVKGEANRKDEGVSPPSSS